MVTSYTNIANAVGDYMNVSTNLSGSITIQIVDGLTMTKSADKASWAGGELTFTIVIDNATTEDYTGVIVTDVLDPAVMTLVPGSVTVDGVPVLYNYDPFTGLLEVLPDTGFDVLGGGSAAITFRVVKA